MQRGKAAGTSYASRVVLIAGWWTGRMVVPNAPGRPEQRSKRQVIVDAKSRHRSPCRKKLFLMGGLSAPRAAANAAKCGA